MRETPVSIVWVKPGTREEKLCESTVAQPGELSGYAQKHLVDEGKISSL
jgi:hypothetical protein